MPYDKRALYPQGCIVVEGDCQARLDFLPCNSPEGEPLVQLTVPLKGRTVPDGDAVVVSLTAQDVQNLALIISVGSQPPRA